jgi:hypothetical protein
MNPNDVDRLLARFFELDAPRQEPDGLLERVVTHTSRRRPTPRWLATLRGTPMTTRTKPFGVGMTRGLAGTLLILAAILLLAIAVVGLGGGSRPPQVAPPVPTVAASPAAPSVAASPSAAPSPSGPAASPRTVAFATDAWSLTYLDGPDWIVGTSSRDIGFENLYAPVFVTIGTLEAAVLPSSIYVTEPELDRSVPTTVDGYLSWLERHPKLDVTDPVDVTVGGRSAKQVDVTLKEGENYAQGSIPSRLGIAWFGEDTVAIGPTNGETHRMKLLDIGGVTVIVDVASMEPGALATGEELIQTIEFGERS